MGALAYAVYGETDEKYSRMTEYLETEDRYWLDNDIWYLEADSFCQAGIKTSQKAKGELADFSGYPTERLKNEMKYFLLYLLLINAVGFALMLIDKWKAKHNRWRIKEATLMTVAALGGSVGSLLGMYTVRHKTKHIKFFVADAQKISKPEFDCKGTLICNPPYGERMMSMRDAETLYKNIGQCFEQMSPWQIYVLTSCEYFEKLYGRRADRVRKLYNGTIPSFLYQFYKPHR